VLIEAMSAGLPILAAPVGGVPEILNDGVEGFYWPLEDVHTGADRLIMVLENPQLHHCMATAALRRFAQDFETDRIATRLDTFLSTMAADVSKR
jgi:glycosyltransferase involved in cell wall biosynthesis